MHEIGDVALIWEVETSLAAVLMEANESGTRISLAELELQTHEVLGGRKLPPEGLREAFQDLKFIFNNGVGLLESAVHRLADPDQRRLLKSELKPDKERILSAVGKDTDFAAYLRAQMPKRNQGAE